MIKTKVPYLNKEIVIEEDEPSTIEELTQLVGEEGLIRHTVKNLRYRYKYPRVYQRVSVEIAKLGFPLKLVKIEEQKDGTEKKIFQDDFDHIASYLTTDPQKHRPVLQELFTRISNEEPLQAPAERVTGGGRVGQGALDAAHRYFAEGLDKVEAVVQKIEEMVPNYKVSRTGEPITPEMLARGIQTLNRHVIARAKMVGANL